MVYRLEGAEHDSRKERGLTRVSPITKRAYFAASFSPNCLLFGLGFTNAVWASAMEDDFERLTAPAGI